MAAADLLEAEGRSLRHHAVRTALAIALAVAAVLLALAGVALLLAAVFIVAETRWGAAPAAGLTALLAFLGAGGLLWLTMRIPR